jgi:hypothetical protein
VKRQPSLSDLGQRNALFLTSGVANHCDFSARVALDGDDFDLLFPSADRRARHHRAAADEASPVGGMSKRPFHPGRRHLQPVALGDRVARVQSRLDRSRRSRAVLDRHLLAVRPVDAHVHDRPALGTAGTELEKFVSELFNFLTHNRFQRLAHVASS